jgi:ankyrin repeat protein
MVRTSCGPLLEILDDETVQVIHHLFTELLLDSSRSASSEVTKNEKRFPVLTSTGRHQSMNFSCLDYLMSGCFESWTGVKCDDFNNCNLEAQKLLMNRFHFLQYSSYNLLYHPARCDTTDTELVLKLDPFFQPGGHDFQSWKDFWLKTQFSMPGNIHPLHVASQAGLTAYTAHLLEAIEDIDMVDYQGRRPAAYCAMHGHSEPLAVLLDRGASLATDDEDGLAPIHYAAKDNHTKALQCLLDAGADPMTPKTRECIPIYGALTHVKSPVQCACELGNADVVSEPLKRLSLSLRSAVLPHWASEKGQARVLSMLLHYPEILPNINKRDVCGNTTLYLAASVKEYSTVRILLQPGADVHMKSYNLCISQESFVRPKGIEDSLGHTPLQGWAHREIYIPHRQQRHSDEQWEETLTLLIGAGADIDGKDERGRTVLFAWQGQQSNYGVEIRAMRKICLHASHTWS